MHEPSVSEAIARANSSSSRLTPEQALHALRANAAVGDVFAFGGLMLLATGLCGAVGELWLGHVWLALVPMAAMLLVAAWTWARNTLTKERPWAAYRTT